MDQRCFPLALPRLMKNSLRLFYCIRDFGSLHMGLSSSAASPAERVAAKSEGIPNRVRFSAEPETERCWEFLSWSRVRESNPPPRLGKPLYYRCTNPACSVVTTCYYKRLQGKNQVFFRLAQKFLPPRPCLPGGKPRSGPSPEEAGRTLWNSFSVSR